jgi:hypothetical protein
MSKFKVKTYSNELVISLEEADILHKSILKTVEEYGGFGELGQTTQCELVRRTLKHIDGKIDEDRLFTLAFGNFIYGNIAESLASYKDIIQDVFEKYMKDDDKLGYI